MFDVALAQASQPAAGPGSLHQLVFMFLPMLVILYFLMFRPQQKKAKDHREMLAKLKKNDEVMTAGGIYGKVMALNDNIITLEIAPNVRVRVQRGHISDLIKGDKVVSKEAKEQ